MNKVKLLTMYMDGISAKDIAKECECTVKTVYKITAAHGLHRKRGTKKPQPIHRQKKRSEDVEPMYREIPTHLSVSNVNEEQKSLIAELKEYRATHEKPWYLR